MSEIAGLNLAPSQQNAPTDQQISARAKATEFEGVFLSMMIKDMFSGLRTEGDFTGGFGEEMFRGMMADQYAEAIAQSGGIGLSDQIYTEILARQEVQ
jgi:peptidoglycan hydrolase FlgJ